MDTGNGIFEKVPSGNQEQLQESLGRMRAEHPGHGGTFYIGQNVEFNQSKFIVIAITKKTMTLKLMPKG